MHAGTLTQLPHSQASTQLLSFALDRYNLASKPNVLLLI